MKTQISFKPFSGEVFLKNKIFEIDNGCNIFFNFKKRLQKHDININTIDIDEGKLIHRYIYCDIPYPWEITYWEKLLKNKGKNILLCFESPLINPFNHIRMLSVFFERIYTWNDNLVDNKKYFKLYIPQLDSKLNTKFAKDKKNFLILINSNKMSPYLLKIFSPFKKDLYTEREKAIKYFDQNIPNEFSLYGKGWNNSKKFSIKEKVFGFKKYITYKGAVNYETKISLLSESKFALCFENCSAPGYITEKIFDCFKARCIPIYWGGPNITDYISKNCFIDFRDFQSYQELINYLKSMNKNIYNQYIENIEKLITNKRFLNLWFERGFEKFFTENILEI